MPENPYQSPEAEGTKSKRTRRSWGLTWLEAAIVLAMLILLALLLLFSAVKLP